MKRSGVEQFIDVEALVGDDDEEEEYDDDAMGRDLAVMVLT